MQAIKSNHCAKVEHLLNLCGPDISLDADNSYCALHFAAHFNRPDIVNKLLVEMKAGIRCLNVVVVII